MSILVHLIIGACYGIAALAAAVLLPQMLPEVSQSRATAIGGVTVFAGLIVQFSTAILHARRQVARQFGEQHEQLRRLAQDLLDTQTQSLHWRQAAEQMGQAGEHRVSQVISEVRVLQGLIESFTEQQARYAAASNRTPQLVAVQGGKSDQRPAMPPVEQDVEEPDLLKILRDALRLDRVDVYLQPIVSLPQRKTRYYECLTRIRAADGTVIGPDSYIALAEREGIVSALDNLLLFRCVQLIRRTRTRNYDVSFFCNISGDSLRDTKFIGDFVDFVSDNRDLASSIYFEIGQADLDSAPTESLENLYRLAEMGFRFSLDQVTHLNLNFAGLAQRSFRFVKVDARFLLDSADEIESDIAVRDIKQQLDRHGLNLIVEKIEAENDLVELLDFEVDYGQGFLFGEPRLSRVD